MIITEIGLEIRVASRIDAESILEFDPQWWCVISIRGRYETRADLSRAKSAVEVVFDDVATEAAPFAPRPNHAQSILEAAGKFRGSPLLVHCAMGISRSPAAALGILYFHARAASLPRPVDFALTRLHQLGDFRPNPLLARLMIAAVDHGKRGSFERFRRHPLWLPGPTLDLYARVLPKPKRDQD